MEEIKIKKAKSANSLLADLLDFHVEVYGTNILAFKSLPTVEMIGIHKSIDVLVKDHVTHARLSCCQCLGYSSFEIRREENKFYLTFPSDCTGTTFTSTFEIQKDAVIDAEIIKQMLDNHDGEILQDLYSAGSLRLLPGNPTPSNYCGASKGVFINTSWEMSFGHQDDPIKKLQNPTEFVKILKCWEDAFGKSFGFSYKWNDAETGAWKLCFDTKSTRYGRHRIGMIELARIPFSNENIVSTMFYFLQSKYGIKFEDPLMGYWFCAMFLHQSGIQSQYLRCFGANNNSPYYGYVTSFNKNSLNVLKEGQAVQISFQGLRTGNKNMNDIGICKDSSIWAIPTSPSAFYLNASQILRANNKEGWFIDEEMFIFSSKHFWNCLLDLLLVNYDEFINFVKKL